MPDMDTLHSLIECNPPATNEALKRRRRASMLPAMKRLWWLAALAMTWTAGAQVPNPSFEQGSGDAPDGWKLSSPPGEWAGGGRTGAHCVAVTGLGEDSNFWRCDGVKFEPSQLYRFAFYARCAPGTTGGLISGPSFANRDLPVSETWDRKSFVFATPTVVPSNACLRLGHWRMKGKAMFDDVDLRPVQAVHARIAGVELGEGETMRDSLYRFHTQLGGDGGNYSHPLDAHSAGFNSNRWTFGPGGYVVYKHLVGSHTQRNGKVTVNICHYEGGRCMIEMSFDRMRWTSVDEVSGLGEKTVQLPSKMFPAGVVYLRLRAESGTEKEKPKPASFQISSYDYEAQLAGRTPDGRGRTDFVEVQQSDKLLHAVCETLGDPLPGGDHNSMWRLINDSDDQAKVLATLEVWRGDRRVSKSSKGVKLFPGHSEAVEMRYEMLDAGDYELRFVERDLRSKRDVFTARVPLTVPLLFASDYGWRLSEEKSKVGLWWCESLRKISRERPIPKDAAQSAVLISAARNESESFQLAINPLKSLSKVSVSLTDLQGPRGAKIPRENIAIHRVAYVHVATPTDETGVAEEWPDPLPPLAPGEQFTPEIGCNTTMWFTVYVPDGVPAGDYDGVIELKEKPHSKYDTSTWSAFVPLRVHVWNFALPKETRLKTALGVSLGFVKAYHNLTTDEELASVWDLYMKNFAAHRISPYWPMGKTGIGVQFDKTASPPRVKLDFAAFDAAAARYLDELGFNTFRLSIEGLGGGGQGKPWHDGTFGGFKQGTPEYEALWGDYARQLADHLGQKGWLRKAFLYWYDEPERSDYAPVRRNNEQIKRLAPKLTRMLTEQPEPELIGAVDIWCPITPNYRADICHERQRAGEHVWWYVCCSPHAPYCTEFIDHAAVELRTWLWQTWGYGVEGILIWETNWWNQPTRFKSPARQNPWEDPMSYSESGTWGNGDGRFLYPPNRDNDRKQKFLDGPVNSIRWEILRDGIEDYEYFALLRELLKSKPDAAAEALLKVPPSVFTDMTHFNADPAPLLQHREKLARAIERLSRK